MFDSTYVRIFQGFNMFIATKGLTVDCNVTCGDA